MIQLIKIEDLKDRKKILSEFDILKTNFLVSDIKSKEVLENSFLEKQSFLTGYSVMRMTEFYKELLSWTHPDWKIVSKNFLGELFIKFASSHSLKWVKNINYFKNFFDYFDQFMPILSHEEGSDLIKEWFKLQGKSASERWGHWYFICEDFYKYIKERKIFYESGIPGLLIDKLDVLPEKSFLSSNIVAELGIHFNILDQKILDSLSKDRKVYLIIPSYEKSHFLEENNYTYLEKDIPAERFLKKKPTQEKIKYSYVGNSTSLEEVKSVVAQVRYWLDSGVPEKHIALLAPSIEDYWFCLDPYLRRENIPVKKNTLVSLWNFPEVKYWISYLRCLLGFEEFSDLEITSFYKDPKMNFSQFRSIHYLFPERDKVTDLRLKKEDPEQEITGREFIDWAISFYPYNGQKDIVNSILQQFQKSILDLSLKREQWLRYLILCTSSQREQELQKENPEGISCLSLNALSSVEASHVIFLGLDEESLKTRSLTALTSRDKSSLLQELGFPLPFFHSGEEESYLFWFLQSSFLKEVVLNSSEFNFSGEGKNKSSFLLWFLKEYNVPKNIQKTQNVWDNQRKQKDVRSILSGLNYKSEDIQFFSHSLNPKENFYQNPNPLTLSYNSLSNYIKCPFVYATSKIFYMEKNEEIKMDVSPKDFGNWVHQLLINLMNEKFEFSEDYIEKIKETLDLKNHLSREESWEVIKYRLELIYKKVLEKEKKLREALPDLKTKGVEVLLSPQTYWNQKKACFDKTGIPVTGQIDRIDYSLKNKEYVLIDYKAGAEAHLGSWKNNHDFQLLLYARALEKGLIESFEAHSVKALLYYGYKQLDVKGYIEKGSEYEPFLSKKSNYPLKNREELEENFKWMEELIQSAVTDMQKGHFSPAPKDEKKCKGCERRLWCRASHLN